MSMLFKRIKDWATSITTFRTGDVIPVDGPSGTAKMSKDTLLELTAQNALAGNVTQAFDATRDNTNPYKAGERVIYQGKTYTFKVDHYGAWSAADVYQLDENDVLAIAIQDKLTGACGKNLFNKNSFNKYANAYIGYNSGNLISVGNYIVYIISIGAGVDLAFNKDNLHVAAFSGKVLVNKESITGNQISGYISGFNSDASHRTWTTPAGCNCISVSVASSQVNSLQVEIGTVPTAYEDYKFGLKQEDVFGLIADLSKKLDGEYGKNLFNKDTDNKTVVGLYMAAGSGNISSASNFRAYCIPVEAGTILSFNKSSLHVCALNVIPDLPSAVSGTSYEPYRTGGFSDEAKQGWSVPAGSVCIVVSVTETNSASMQVEKGSSSTSYEPFNWGIPVSKVLGIGDYATRTFYVGAGYQYASIQDAVDNVPNGSTIMIMPGVYDEDVDVHSSGKKLHIVGFNRDSCIIRKSNATYATPPMEIGEGFVENLTIEATENNTGVYCVHIDYYEENNSALQFVNCKFKNSASQCVGIGLRGNFTLSFIECSFESPNYHSPVYCHEAGENNKKNQRIELIDCAMLNTNVDHIYPAVTLQEATAYTGNEATLLIQRCILKSAGGSFDSSHPAIQCIDYSSGSQPSSGGGKYLDSHIWTLDPMSELNNESIVNAGEQ